MGIDYGNGKTNIDLETGIRYGVISQHSVSGEALDDMESDYGDPHCPKCGNDAVDMTDDRCVELTGAIDGWNVNDDFGCLHCQQTFRSDEVFSDEACGQYLDDGQYKVCGCLDSDLMVILSPYWTRAPFCSPCVPGAGNLDSATTDVPTIPTQPKTYCLGHDWFDCGYAPYPVYRVSDNKLVIPE